MSHILDLLSLVLLSAIWALCPRDSLAVLGHWVQQKLSQVSSRVLLSERQLFHISFALFRVLQPVQVPKCDVFKVVVTPRLCVSPPADVQSSLQ